MDATGHKVVSVLAHVMRFGGALVLLAGFVIDALLTQGVTLGQSRYALLFYMYGAVIMFSGIVLELFYHYWEREWLV